MIILFHSAENISASPVVKTTQQKQKKSETIYHVVKPHETLFSIAKKYNSNITEIKKWNKLKNDDLKIGQKLIVGNGKNKKLDEPKKVLKEAPKNLKPATERVIKKTEQEIAKPILPVEKKEEVVPVVKQKEKREIIEQGLVTWIDDEMINPDKYYALHASAPMGTIIKITNGINGKSVYVKVVGKLSSRDESQKIKIKISKSAANKLEVLDERFQAELSYSLSP
ncbi:MAG: LysM peptidoglycan-binding domain-containing protein [Bacteroidia bacterium]|nr:LysM peptidoglycan-binding domain-containing protein [Bacteroidia bacterium]